MVYTVTLNPALDYSMSVDEISLGQTNRSCEEGITFGGKGLNVSYVLSQLGVDSVALGFVAGFTGEELVRAVSSVGIKTDFIRLSQGNTRINVKLKGETETEINASGPMIEKKDIDLLFEKTDRLQSGDILVLSGSVPPSAGNDIYQRIMQRLQGKDVSVAVDASGNALLNALKYRPFLIKPNVAELEETLKIKIDSQEDIIKAAKELQTLGAQNVLVSRGPLGAILIEDSGQVHIASAPKIAPKNTVGAGDSMLAGFIAGVEKGYDHALKLGIASGSASAASDKLAVSKEIFLLLK